MNDIEKRIIETLKQYPYGLTTSDLSRITKINRVSLSKHLEILKERGYIGYRIVGKAKLWYLSEDTNILDAIYGDNQLNKMLRQDEKKYFYIGSNKFVILPAEFFQMIYLEAWNRKDFNIVRGIGRGIGSYIGITFKMASGIEKVVREPLVRNILSMIEKMGFGKIDNLIIDKNLNTSISFSYLVESEILRSMSEDIFADIKKNLKDFFMEGLLEGLFSAIYSIPVISYETASIIQDSQTSDFIIKKK